MTNDGEWVEVVVAMPMAEARRAFEQWKQNHPELDPLKDDDVRVDLIRTTEGDRIRYQIRAETLQPPVGD